MVRAIPWSLCFLMVGGGAACGETESRISTRQDRQALFDELIEKTLAREAFSEIKNRRLGLDVEAAMRAFEDEVVGAASEEELFYALVKVSNARRDRHLRVSTVEDGLRVEEEYDLSANTNYPGLDLAGSGPPTAPIRFAVDYGAAPEAYSLFVADLGENIADFAGGAAIRIGDVLTAIGDLPIGEHMERIRPYYRYSTENGFWVRAAEGLNRKTPILPRSFYGDDLKVTLAGDGGTARTVRLPYLRASATEWQGHGEPRYDGFEPVAEFGIFDLYRHAAEPILLLAWKRFGATLIADMDALMELAEEAGYLDHDLIWDGTRSRGGGLGAYALQRLSPRPFKTTFGNLRLSDTTLPFIDKKRRELEEEGTASDGVPEIVDDGTWLMEWLEGDVMRGLAAGQDYSNTVPFKTAHAPEWSDGVLRPAAKHFRGRMVCLLGPYGGSHLDQFAAIVVDNGLCEVLGMPAGGYSNTWEWEEVLEFPISGRPVVEFMWSIGHTVRPNGQVLEGNPAEVDVRIPVTRENYAEYYPLLLRRALARLEG